MYIPKRYGDSRNDACPFCGKQATTQNKQGVPVCQAHKSNYLENLKCLCGDWIDIQSGKWGPYGICMKCGNVSWAKVKSANPNMGKISSSESNKKPTRSTSYSTSKPKQQQYQPLKPVKNENPHEIVVTSDEVDFI